MRNTITIVFALVLLLIGGSSASGQTPPPAAEVYKGYVATAIPLPTGCASPLQTRISPDGQVLAVLCDQTLFVRKDGGAWEVVGYAGDFTLNPTKTQSKFRFADWTGGLGVTDKHILVSTHRVDAIGHLGWDTTTAVDLATGAKRHLASFHAGAKFVGGYSQTHILGDSVVVSTLRTAVRMAADGVGGTTEAQAPGILLGAWSRPDGSVVMLTDGPDGQNNVFLHKDGINTLLVDGVRGFPMAGAPNGFDGTVVCCDVVPSGENIYLGYKARGGHHRVMRLSKDGQITHVMSNSGASGALNRPMAASKAGVLASSFDAMGTPGGPYPRFPDSLWFAGSGQVVKLAGHGESLLGSPLFGLLETSKQLDSTTNISLDDFGTIFFSGVYKSPNGTESSRLIRLSRPRSTAITPSALAQGEDFTVTGDFLSAPGTKTDLLLGAGAPVDACVVKSEKELRCSSAIFPIGQITVRVRIGGAGGSVVSNPLTLTVTAPPTPISITRFAAEPLSLEEGQTTQVCFLTSEPASTWVITWTGLSGASREFGVGDIVPTPPRAVASADTCVRWSPPETGEFRLRVSARGNTAAAGPIRVEVAPPPPQIISVVSADDTAPVAGSRAYVKGQFLGSQECEVGEANVTELCGVRLETAGGEPVPVLLTSQSMLVIQIPQLAGEIWIRVAREGKFSDWVMIPVAEAPAPPTPEPEPGGSPE